MHLSNYSEFEESFSSAGEQAAVEVYVDDTADFEARLLLLSSTSLNAPPYSFAVYLPDPSPECSELVIESCEIVYADGSSHELLPAPVSVPVTQEPWKDKHWLKDAIGRTEGFVLTVRGYRLVKDGSRVPYDQRFEFDHKRVKGVLPAIVVWNGV